MEGCGRQCEGATLAFWRSVAGKQRTRQCSTEDAPRGSLEAGRGCQILEGRGARAIPCEASKPMCERKGWHKVGEHPRAEVGCSTWGVDKVGGGTHPVGQR